MNTTQQNPLDLAYILNIGWLESSHDNICPRRFAVYQDFRGPATFIRRTIRLVDELVRRGKLRLKARVKELVVIAECHSIRLGLVGECFGALRIGKLEEKGFQQFVSFELPTRSKSVL
jgi:hypothetical protein